jgi:hypothetical protein
VAEFEGGISTIDPYECREINQPMSESLDTHAIPLSPDQAFWFPVFRFPEATWGTLTDIRDSWRLGFGSHRVKVAPAPGRRLAEQHYVLNKNPNQILNYGILMAVAGSERTKSIIVSAMQFSDVITRLNDLSFAPEQDQYGAARPSYHASRNCIKLFADLVKLEGCMAAPTDIGLDRNADIRVTWGSLNREIDLVSPSDESQRPYVYHSSPTDYGIDELITPERLSRWIRWSYSTE